MREGLSGAGAAGQSEAFGEVKYPKANASTGLVKEGSTVTWKAKSGEGYVFAGWAWTNGTPAASFSSLSENERKNPTLKLRIAAGEQVRPTDVASTWAWIDEDRIGAVTLMSSNLVVESLSYVTAKVSGLPSGLKFDKKTLAITGKAKKDETKTVKVDGAEKAFEVVIGESAVGGLGYAALLGVEGSPAFAMAVQNGWKLPKGDPRALPEFPSGKASIEVSVTNGVSLTLKFGAKGVVKVAGAVGGEKVSAKAQVLPFELANGKDPLAYRAQVCVYAPKAGFCEVFEFVLTVGADGKFDTVQEPQQAENLL